MHNWNIHCGVHLSVLDNSSRKYESCRMKRFIILGYSALSALLGYSQQWVLDEIADENKINTPITFLDLIILGVLILLGFLLYKFSKYLRTLNIEKYKKFLRIGIGCAVITAVIIPISILTYYDVKRDNQYKDAIKTMNVIVRNADSYISLANQNYFNPSFNEIEPLYKDTPSNEIYGNSYSNLMQKAGIPFTPYDGVYKCYNISNFGNEVIFATKAKKLGFSTDEDPVLYHGYIKPYRIRYYSSDNISPYYDLWNTYGNFIQNFIFENGCQRRDDITNSFFHRSLNEYFEISHHEGGDEMWQNNKRWYNHEIMQERSYEYKTINYGKFDIIYCISRPCKIGVCEKMVSGNILGHEIFDEIHLVRRYQALAKWYIIWFVIVASFGITFYLGRPQKETK